MAGSVLGEQPPAPPRTSARDRLPPPPAPPPRRHTPRWSASACATAPSGTRHSSTSATTVELAVLPQGIAIRDSKAPGAGLLTLTPEGFADLVKQVKRSESGFAAPG
ncbi:DUF397 domain-containing protein [Actinomadura sp. 9N215]|uniref:DUF397 domain-containing protein n=1 Tax=Actinomadura sp. 9N215 TaxID=3375150 RepID=UPI00379AF6E2